MSINPNTKLSDFANFLNAPINERTEAGLEAAFEEINKKKNSPLGFLDLFQPVKYLFCTGALTYVGTGMAKELGKIFRGALLTDFVRSSATRVVSFLSTHVLRSSASYDESILNGMTSLASKMKPFIKMSSFASKTTFDFSMACLTILGVGYLMMDWCNSNRQIEAEIIRKAIKASVIKENGQDVIKVKNAAGNQVSYKFEEIENIMKATLIQAQS